LRYNNLKSFQKHLSSAAPRHLSRVYLIAIGDDFERSKAIDCVLSYVLAPDSSSSRFSGGDLDTRDLLDAIQSPNLFGGDPVVVLDEAEKIPKKTVQLLSEAIASQSGFLLIGSRGKTPLASVVEKEGVVLDLTDEKPWDKEKRLADQLVERAKNAGKRLEPGAALLLFERLDKDAALLENEIDKLICYTGGRNSIAREDVLAVSAASRTSSLWQTAEEIVWEGKMGTLDANSFHAAIPSIRSQLHLGMVLSTLIEENVPPDQWNAHLPKLWPKTLEKRSSQAAHLGSRYFQKGLEKLFEIENASRSGSTQYAALLDLFRVHLAKAAPK
jgi:DNA polymerase III subunit delta